MSDSYLPSSFRIGPLSPPSPSAGSFKANVSPPTSKVLTPQTPSSPPLMSVSAQNYASAFTNPQASPGLATSQGQPLSSPLSSTPMSTQVSQQQTVSTTNSFPTPASSVSGHLTGIAFIDEEKPSSGRRLQNRNSIDVGGTAVGHDRFSGHRRTDHDRQDKSLHARDMYGGRTCSGGQSMAEDENMMELDEDTGVSTADNHLSLDSLQKDIGLAFHLCKTSHPMSGPDPSLDLVSLYGLGSVGQSVMRADPVTGEKINRLRKSYEGKLKGLGLAGRNKPVKHEPGTPGGLRQMSLWPEEEWQNQKVLGKEIKIASMDSPLYDFQMNAMKMEPGTIPNHEYWEDILGHEKPPKHATPAEAGKKAVAPPTTATTARQPGQPNGTPAAIEPERSRPSRGKKRHYDDSSFVGYGEGYADDDDEAAFYSNSEEMGRAGKKKRKKEHVPKIAPTIPERGGTYGVGMFGIGAR